MSARKPLKRVELKRAPMRRSRIDRDWTAARAKVTAEGKCRGCGRTEKQLREMGRKLEAAHTIGREFDRKDADGVRYVDPDAVFPLCGPPTSTDTCHAKFDGHTLDAEDLLTGEEWAWAIARVGQGQARRRIMGRDAG